VACVKVLFLNLVGGVEPMDNIRLPGLQADIDIWDLQTQIKNDNDYNKKTV
jgi:hypothetical protein